MESTPAPAAEQSMRTPLALPSDVVVDIVGLVAATSTHPFADLGSMASTCKTMYAATKEHEVLRRVALEKEDTMKWCDNNRYLTLLKNMAGAGNPEACFLHGLMLVFTHQGKQSGLALLQKAADAGHKTAAYVLGVVLYSANDTREAAKQYIRQVEAESCAGIVGCRTNWTNRECRRCRQVALMAILDIIRGKKMAGAPSQVLRATYDNLCASEGCDLTKPLPNYNSVFCSEDCRIKYEYNKFLLINSCYGAFCQDTQMSKIHS